MTNDHRATFSQRIHQSDDATGQLENVVRLDLLRTIRLPVAAHVWSDHPITRIRERSELITPGTPNLGEAVQQDAQRRGTRLNVMHPDTVALR